MKEKEPETIYFYSNHEDPYGCFSNFSRHGFTLDGKYWPTSEHYFQAQKFVDEPTREQVRLQKSPKLAAEAGRDRKKPLRKDWEEVKDEIMYRAVLAKFQAHTDIKAILLGTGEKPLVENAPGDYYWGCGADGSGLNMLGKILVRVRSELIK
ncbi:MAG: NADAR family protein [Chloroflexi bacterium]|nr:NADAR family protein [Chloroflexota bacterium]OJV91228.1 MAG: Swarming motility protein ybiA [Chloroflexi bacterium 54-19]